ncbi:MAG TPA: hypothetical protein VHC22_17610 [Pirellulales bacterium]|nr:hypothetical protein [Pirellulales bacterium]
MFARFFLLAGVPVLAVTWLAPRAIAEAPQVDTWRLPEGAIQPQVAVGDDGTVHLLYLRGDPRRSDLFYVRPNAADELAEGAKRVNRGPGSVIAVGNIRGAHLALGRNDRVHVAWMGASQAEVKGPGGATPMLYTRLDDEGTFAAERNVITAQVGLDGGGSLAADRQGNVYVVWHAPTVGTKGEVNRRVWVAHSEDDGRTFEPERAAREDDTGCCGCCGMRALADRDGHLFILYRSAEQAKQRDMWLLASDNRSRTFSTSLVDRWEADTCVMSTAALAAGSDSADGPLAAWETQGQVYFGRVHDGRISHPTPAPGLTGGRKHPTVAVNKSGQIVLAWTEGMGWERGGMVAWQIFDADQRPIAGAAGRAAGVPVWSLVAAFARPDGQFVVVY